MMADAKLYATACLNVRPDLSKMAKSPEISKTILGSRFFKPF